MKKSIIIISILLLVPTLFAIDVRLINSTEVELGKTVFKDSKFGIADISNSAEVEVETDFFSVYAGAAFALDFVYGDNSYTANSMREKIEGVSFSADDDTEISLFVRPFNGFEFALGTNVSQNIIDPTYWWNEDQKMVFRTVGKTYLPHEYWFASTQYINAGFMLRYDGFDNLFGGLLDGLTVAAVLPADGTLDENGQPTEDFFNSTYNADRGDLYVPLNFAVNYKIEDFFSVGFITKTHLLQTDAHQFTLTGSYDSLPLGPINAFFSFTTDPYEGTENNQGFMLFGVNADLRFEDLGVGDLRVLPDVSFYVPNYKPENSKGFPFFAGLRAQYYWRNMTPGLDMYYAMGEYADTPKGELSMPQVLTIEPKFSIDFGYIGSLQVSVIFDAYFGVENMSGVAYTHSTFGTSYGHSDPNSVGVKWTIPISWKVEF